MGEEKEKERVDQAQNNYYKAVSENKEVEKIQGLVKAAPNLMRSHINQHLQQFNQFHDLWMDDRDETVTAFKAEGPLLGDWKSKIVHFDMISDQIEELPSTASVGPITLDAENVKQSLQVEAKTCKVLL